MTRRCPTGTKQSDAQGKAAFVSLPKTEDPAAATCAFHGAAGYQDVQPNSAGARGQAGHRGWLRGRDAARAPGPWTEPGAPSSRVSHTCRSVVAAETAPHVQLPACQLLSHLLSNLASQKPAKLQQRKSDMPTITSGKTQNGGWTPAAPAWRRQPASPTLCILSLRVGGPAPDASQHAFR